MCPTTKSTLKRYPYTQYSIRKKKRQRFSETSTWTVPPAMIKLKTSFCKTLLTKFPGPWDCYSRQQSTKVFILCNWKSHRSSRFSRVVVNLTSVATDQSVCYVEFQKPPRKLCRMPSMITSRKEYIDNKAVSGKSALQSCNYSSTQEISWNFSNRKSRALCLITKLFQTFDTVPHGTLLRKLWDMGLKEICWNFWNFILITDCSTSKQWEKEHEKVSSPVASRKDQ